MAPRRAPAPRRRRPDRRPAWRRARSRRPVSVSVLDTVPSPVWCRPRCGVSDSLVFVRVTPAFCSASSAHSPPTLSVPKTSNCSSGVEGDAHRVVPPISFSSAREHQLVAVDAARAAACVGRRRWSSVRHPRVGQDRGDLVQPEVEFAVEQDLPQPVADRAGAYRRYPVAVRAARPQQADLVVVAQRAHRDVRECRDLADRVSASVTGTTVQPHVSVRVKSYGEARTSRARRAARRRSSPASMTERRMPLVESRRSASSCSVARRPSRRRPPSTGRPAARAGRPPSPSAAARCRRSRSK